jgi:uncharacterized LabA/DUF88 family protein
MSTAFLIDGFNFYYSIKSISNNLKWFDYSKFCKHYLLKNQSVYGIYYFTAIAKWLPETAKRHMLFIEAQKKHGIKVILGEFKEKTRYCSHCRECYQDHEEKRTDVNIALYAYRLASLNEVDQIIIISGDSDLIPVIELIKKDFKEKKVGFILPPNRASKIIREKADFTRKVKIDVLDKFQLPNKIVISKYKTIYRPDKWT